MEESQNLRQSSKLPTLGQNFLHIYFGLAERLLSEETTSDGGRNFRSALSSRACKIHRKLQKNQKNVKLLLLASYLHALYDRTIECVVWQLFLCSFIYAI